MFTSGINKIENLREKSEKIKELHLRQIFQRRIIILRNVCPNIA